MAETEAEAAQKPEKKARVEYELLWPVQFGTETITHLTLRRPKGKDMRAMRGDRPTTGETLDLLGRLSAQPKPVVDEIDAEDITALAEIIAGFFGSSPPTGDGPSPS